MTLHETGALRPAEQAAADAAEVALQAGDAQATATAQIRLSLIRADLGDYAGALSLVLPYTRALSPRVDLPVQGSTAPRDAAGDGRTTADALPRAAGAGAQLSDGVVAAHAHAAAGRVYRLLHDSARAAASLRQAVSLQAAAQGGPDISLDMGLTELAAGQADAALATLSAARAESPGTRSEAERALLLTATGRALMVGGRLDEASARFSDAARTAHAAGARLALTEARHAAGDLARLTGNTLASLEAYREALTLAAELSVPRIVAPVAYALYESAAARGSDGLGLESLRQHAAARLTLTGEEATRRLLDVEAGARDTEAADERTLLIQATRRADMLRTGLLGASLAALVLAALLWRLGYTRGRRVLHYRQEIDALTGILRAMKTVDGLLTICASCKDVRQDNDEWVRVEAYLRARTDAEFTHSVCPRCEQRLLARAADDGALLAELAGSRAWTAPEGDDSLQGGFDWPPTDDELARVTHAAEWEAEQVSARAGRWS